MKKGILNLILWGGIFSGHFKNVNASCSISAYIEEAESSLDFSSPELPLFKNVKRLAQLLETRGAKGDILEIIKGLKKNFQDLKQLDAIDKESIQKIMNLVDNLFRVNPEIIEKNSSIYLDLLTITADYLLHLSVELRGAAYVYWIENTALADDLILHCIGAMKNISAKEINQYPNLSQLNDSLSSIVNSPFGYKLPPVDVLKKNLAIAKSFPVDSPLRASFLDILYNNWASRIANQDISHISLEYLDLIEEFIHFTGEMDPRILPLIAKSGYLNLKRGYHNYLLAILNRDNRFPTHDFTPELLNRVAKIIVDDTVHQIVSGHTKLDYQHLSIRSFLDVCANEKVLSDQTKSDIFKQIYVLYQKEYGDYFYQRMIGFYFQLSPNAQVELTKLFPKHIQEYIAGFKKPNKVMATEIYPPIEKSGFFYDDEDLKWVEYFSHSNSTKAREAGILPRPHAPLFKPGETEVTNAEVRRRWAIDHDFSVKNVPSDAPEKMTQDFNWAVSWTKKTLLHKDGEVDSWAAFLLPGQVVDDSTSEMALQLERVAIARLIGGDIYTNAMKKFSTRTKKVRESIDGLGNTFSLYRGNYLYNLDGNSPDLVAGIKTKFRIIAGDPHELKLWIQETEEQLSTMTSKENIEQIQARLGKLKKQLERRESIGVDIDYQYRTWVKENPDKLRDGMEEGNSFFNPIIHSSGYSWLNSQTIYAHKDSYTGNISLVRVTGIDELRGELRVIGVIRGLNGQYINDSVKWPTVKIQDLYLTKGPVNNLSSSGTKVIQKFKPSTRRPTKLTFREYTSVNAEGDYNNTVALGAIKDPLARNPIILPHFKGRPIDNPIGFVGDSQFVEIDPLDPKLPAELKELMKEKNLNGGPMYCRLKITRGHDKDAANNYLFLALETTEGETILVPKSWDNDFIRSSQKSKEYFLNTVWSKKQEIGDDLWSELAEGKGPFPDFSNTHTNLRAKYENINEDKYRYDYETFIIPEAPKRDLPHRRYTIDEYRQLSVTRERLEQMPADIPFSVIINQSGQIRMAPQSPNIKEKTALILADGENVLSSFTLVKKDHNTSKFSIQIGNGFYPDIENNEKQKKMIQTLLKNLGFENTIFN